MNYLENKNKEKIQNRDQTNMYQKIAKYLKFPQK